MEQNRPALKGAREGLAAPRSAPAGAPLTRPPEHPRPARPRRGPAGGLQEGSGELQPPRSPRGPRRQTSAFPLQQRP